MTDRKVNNSEIESPDVGSLASASPNQWLRSLNAFDRNRVYALTSALSEQSNGISQNDFILQYAMGKRDWKRDHDKMFGVSKKKAN